jgi:hypothetical protein
MMIGARGVGLHRTVLYALVHFRRGAGSGFGLCRCSARILARSRSNVIRHALQIVGAARMRATYSSTQPNPVLARNCLRLVPAHLPRRNAARLTQALHPDNRRADAYAELRRCLVARHASSLNRGNHAFAKIY